MAAQKAILKTLIEDQIVELMVKSQADNIWLDETTTVAAKIATLVTDIATAQGGVDTLNDAVTVDGSVLKMIKDNAQNATYGEASATIASTIAAIETTLGDMTAVKTTAKTVAGAIDELYDAIGSAESAGVVTIDSTGTPTEGYLKTYVVSQGGTEVGKIDIPKDLVVTSGEVVVDPEGQAKGTYIKLTIANQETPVFINVKDLCDVYTAAKDAAQVQLAISDTNEISATIVAGSITSTELAADSVTTAKIADANVTKAKLDSTVQASLDKADAAATDISTLKGTVSEDGSILKSIKDNAKDATYSDDKTIGDAISALETSVSDAHRFIVSASQPTDLRAGDLWAQLID